MQVKIDGVACVDDGKAKKVSGTLPLDNYRCFDNAVDTWIDCVANELVEDGYTVDEVFVERITISDTVTVTGPCFTKTVKTKKKPKKGRKR